MKKYVIYRMPDIFERDGLIIGQPVMYRGQQFKVHSFPNEPGKVNLKKYRKDGKLDARHKGYYADIKDITT